jgi:peptidyl-prolyl cis-trans isomerase SurA
MQYFCFPSRPRLAGIPKVATNRILGTALLCCLILFASSNTALARTLVNKVAAVVNGEVVTLYELDRQSREMLGGASPDRLNAKQRAAFEASKKKLLGQIINDILLRQEVEKYGIEVADVEVDAQIREFMQARGIGEEGFKEILTRELMTREEFAEDIRRDIQKHRLLGLMVRRKVVVTEEEIRESYEEVGGTLQDGLLRLSLIMLPKGESAADLKQRIEEGEISFEAAADEFSIGPGKGEGGDLGQLEWDDLAPTWQKALERISVGEMSNPFTLRGHRALLLLKSADAKAKQPFDEVREDIRNEIYRRKLEGRFKEYMSSLRENAIIEEKL